MLKMQGNLIEIKTDGMRIVPGLIGDESRQINKIRVAMQLPHPIDIVSPGAGFRGIARGLSTQNKQVL